MFTSRGYFTNPWYTASILFEYSYLNEPGRAQQMLYNPHPLFEPRKQNGLAITSSTLYCSHHPAKWFNLVYEHAESDRKHICARRVVCLPKTASRPTRVSKIKKILAVSLKPCTKVYGYMGQFIYKAGQEYFQLFRFFVGNGAHDRV